MTAGERVIVIGASAGGVHALQLLADTLPDDIAASILVVLHIGAHRSQLPDLLNVRRAGRAQLARTGQVPEPGRIYIAPPDRHLLFEDGALRLFNGPKEHHARPAINPLFRSAALELGQRVIGVILTGMLDDGSAGLHAIKLCGGTSVVQDPDEAVEPCMPRSALASAPVDYVVGLGAMAGLLNMLAAPLARVVPVAAPEWLRVEHAVSMGRKTMDDLGKIGMPSSFTCPDCGGALFELNDGLPVRFLCHTGHAFSLRSLAWAHGLVTDEALWSGLRALQEKEAILRRVAATPDPDGSAQALAEADELAGFIASMRSVVSSAPAAGGETGSELPSTK